MKRLLAGALVSVFCLGIAGSTPAQVEAAGSMGICLVFHNPPNNRPGRWMWVREAALRGHYAHGDALTEMCSIDVIS